MLFVHNDVCTYCTVRVHVCVCVGLKREEEECLREERLMLCQ